MSGPAAGATRRGLLLGAGGGVLLLPATRARAAPARVHTVVMDDMVFGPPPTGARVGDTIVWVNRDMFRHTATARDGSFDVDLAPGRSGRTVLRTAGTIRYFCRFHPAMTGQLTVGS